MKRSIKITIEIIQEEGDMESKIDPRSIINAVCEQLDVDPALKGRSRQVAECVSIIVALLLKLGMTVSEVAKHVKRDRSTVIYHRKLVNNLKAYNLEFKEKLEQSEKTIVGKFLSPNKQYNE